MHFSRLPNHRRPHATAGFSLVEVVLAVGVVGFAFVALLGLLPVGMQTFRQAVDTSVRAQIVQQIVNDSLQADFDTLAAAPADRYFSDQGSEVSRTGSIYHARVRVVSSTDLPAGASSGQFGNADLATIVIAIANNPELRADPFIGNDFSETAIFVARNK